MEPSSQTVGMQLPACSRLPAAGRREAKSSSWALQEGDAARAEAAGWVRLVRGVDDNRPPPK